MRFIILAAAMSLFAACSTETNVCDETVCTTSCRKGCNTDSNAPVITITSPVAGSVVSSETLEIAATVTDLSSVSVKVYVDGMAVQSAMPVLGRVQASFALSAQNGTPLTVVVKATDAYDNASEAQAEVVIDNQAPVLCLAAPVDGVMVLAADPAVLAVEGTAVDGTLEKVEVSVDGAAPQALVVEGQAFLGGVPLVQESGATHRIVVRAADRAGHESIVEREYHVDRVAPQVTALPVDLRRGVGCPVNLVEFSEEMDEGSVLAATTVNGQPVGSSFSLRNGRELMVSDCAVLPAGRPIELAVSTQARDLAGNPLSAAAVAHFLRRADPVPFGQGLFLGSHPSLAFDEDYLPFIGFWDPVESVFKLMWWNGQGGFVGVRLFESAALATPCERPVHLTVSSHLAEDGLSLRRDVELVACGAKAGARSSEVHYLKGTLTYLDGQFETTSTLIDANAPSRGNPRIHREQRAGGSTTRITFARQNVSGNIEVWERSIVDGALGQPVALATGLGNVTAVGGDAVLAGSNIFYVPANATPAFTDTGIGSVFGSRARWAEIAAGETTYWGRDKSAFLAWSTTDGTEKIHIACARGDALAPLWRGTEQAVSSSWGAIRQVQLEIGRLEVAVAVESAGSQVHLGTAYNTACDVAPWGIIWDPVIENAREPWTAALPGGSWRTAYVDTHTGKITLH